MPGTPESVADFLRGKRIAVAGVSRVGRGSAANAVFAKLRDCGYEVFPVNPNASQVEGIPCYPDLVSIPAELDGVVVVTHPSVSAGIVKQAAERGIPRVWLHRSFRGSVSAAAVRECKKATSPASWAGVRSCTASLLIRAQVDVQGTRVVRQSTGLKPPNNAPGC